MLFFALTTGLSFAYACSWGTAGGNGPMPDAATQTSGAHCGDGVCAPSELSTCPADCGSGNNGSNGSNNVAAVCGNGICETTKGEDSASCPSDCGSGSGSGGGSGSCDDENTIFACFACEAGLGCTGVTQSECDTCLGLGGGLGDDSACDGGAPDGTCSATEMQNPTTCIDDCL